MDYNDFLKKESDILEKMIKKEFIKFSKELYLIYEYSIFITSKI